MGSYYDDNAEAFAARANAVDLSGLYAPFVAQLPAGGRILDVGCGSGRDLKAFAALGYRVEGLDPSEAMVAMAAAYSGAKVRCGEAQDITAQDVYDGIWACASLLHVPQGALALTVTRLVAALKAGGVAYLSFKEGAGERQDGARRFTDMDATSLRCLLEGIPSATVGSIWIEEGVARAADGSTIRWVNALVSRQ